MEDDVPLLVPKQCNHLSGSGDCRGIGDVCKMMKKTPVLFRHTGAYWEFCDVFNTHCEDCGRPLDAHDGVFSIIAVKSDPAIHVARTYEIFHAKVLKLASELKGDERRDLQSLLDAVDKVTEELRKWLGKYRKDIEIFLEVLEEEGG